MITRVNFPSASTSKKLQLCMSFFEPSLSSPKYPCSVATFAAPGSTTMLRISWPIETEAPKKSVNMRRISAAPVNVTWSVCTVSVASSAKHA